MMSKVSFFYPRLQLCLGDITPLSLRVDLRYAYAQRWTQMLCLGPPLAAGNMSGARRGVYLAVVG